MDVSHWNLTSRFRRLKSAATKTEILTHPLGAEDRVRGDIKPGVATLVLRH